MHEILAKQVRAQYKSIHTIVFGACCQVIETTVLIISHCTIGYKMQDHHLQEGCGLCKIRVSLGCKE